MVTEPGIIFTIASFIVLLTVLVFVHEWGHYIVARIFNVKVETFSIGFGKEIFGWRDKKDTHWKVGWLPLGGYVKFFGDASAISNPGKYLKRIAPDDRDRCFHFKPIWQRMLIVAAGPTINFLFAIFLFIGFSIVTGFGQLIDEPLIGKLIEGEAAYEAGFEAGDRISVYDGKEINTFFELRDLVINNPGKEMTFEVLRGQEWISITVVPKPTEIVQPDGQKVIEGRLGFEAKSGHNILTGIRVGTVFTYDITIQFFKFFGKIFQGEVSLDDLGGPVKIAQVSGQAAAQGVPTFIYIMGLISINLGIVNFLPIPLLDGGHLLFYSIEAVKGSPISVRAQEMASMVGLAVVLGLLFILTWNDLNLPGLG